MVFSVPVLNRHAYVYTGISTFTQIGSYSHCPLTILIEQVQGASNRCAQLGPIWGTSAVAAAPPEAGSLPQALQNHNAVARHPYAQFLHSPVQVAHDGIYCSRCPCGSSAECWFIQWLKWKYFCLPVGHNKWLPIKRNPSVAWHVQINALHRTNSHGSSSQAKMGAC